MVQSLPGFLNLCLDVCSPSQVLGDVYTEVLEAAYSLHRGPADHKRSVGLWLTLSQGANLSPFGEIRRFHLEIGHSRESCRSVKKKKRN